MDRNNNLLLAILFAVSSPFTLLLTIVFAIPVAIMGCRVKNKDHRYIYLELDEAEKYVIFCRDVYSPDHPRRVGAEERYRTLKAELLRKGLVTEDDLELFS